MLLYLKVFNLLTIPMDFKSFQQKFGFSIFVSVIVNLVKVTDECSLHQPLLLTILLIWIDFKWRIRLNKSIFLYFDVRVFMLFAGVTLLSQFRVKSFNSFTFLTIINQFDLF